MRAACRHLLGIETSCDETAAAVITSEARVLSNIVSSQHELHGKFGGVVPELASRRHIESIELVTMKALQEAGISWQDLYAIAVTRGPGLAGALHVGLSFAKSLAYALNLPIIGVNHLEGHIASAWLDEPDFPVPCIVLVVSGGHTHLFLVRETGTLSLLGRTLDDAAGEAFDKAGKMLGLDYPGGPAIDRLARKVNRDAVAFPRPYLKKASLDFSFSGLKTALLYHLRGLDKAGQPRPLADLAASFQEAIVEVLVEKAFQALDRFRVPALAVVGGVSANSRLRSVLAARAESARTRLSLPALQYCTDNAAMIALAGQRAYARGRLGSWDMEAEAGLHLSESESKRSSTRGKKFVTAVG